VAASRSRQRVQNAVMLAITLIAVLSVGTGLLLLSGHMLQVRENNRYVFLKNQIQQEREKERELLKLNAEISTNERIQQLAKLEGMVPPNGKEPISLP
jgi:cell division protein FtsL